MVQSPPGIGAHMRRCGIEGAFMESEKQILVVDDDSRYLESIQDFLQPHGFGVHTLSRGEQIMDAVREHAPDIILLDVMMPGEDGFSVLQRLRAQSRLPVIMLTARGEETDRIVGLELGADDYLAKPFSPRELLARIKAVLRRSADRESDSASGQPAPPYYAAFSGDCIDLDGYSLDARRQKLSRNGTSVKLSTAEFCLVFTLMTHPGQVLSREQIQLLAFSRGDYASDRNIDVYVSRVRSMLRTLGDSSDRVRTVWGTGYCWVRDN